MAADVFSLLIGNQTSFAAQHLLEPFHFALAHSFGAFEWFSDKQGELGWTLDEIDEKTRRLIKEMAGKVGIRMSVHAPWEAHPKDGGFDAVMAKCLTFLHDVGATLLNIHYFPELGPENFSDGIGQLMEETCRSGISLSIENTVHCSPEAMNELFRAIQKRHGIIPENMGLCFDMGHANLCHATRNDYVSYLDRLAPEVPLIHLHLHENYGDHDAHLPLFTGPAGKNDLGVRLLLERLRERQFRGTAILEQWPEPPSLLLHAKDRLLGLASEVNSRNALKDSSTAREPGGFSSRERETDNTSSTGEKTVKIGSGGTGDAFLRRIAAMDGKNRSWREKLTGVLALLDDLDAGKQDDALAAIAVYLRFIGTGEIPCQEDGNHYRPHHHAALSQKIMERLARVRSQKNTYIVKRIYPWLPSISREFMRSDPLTRIRDIAHRNDIPGDLKKEVKHTLQNKLHRCAGPEDLRTAKNLLDRILRNKKEYSSSFVREFQLFHEELREFFNRADLDARLAAYGRDVTGNTDHRRLIEEIGRLRKSGKKSNAHLLRLMDLISTLREKVETKKWRDEVEMQQDLMLGAELGEYFFVLAADLASRLPTMTSPSFFQAGLDAVILLVVSMRMDGLFPEESKVVARELTTWKEDLDTDDRGHLLRLLASLSRCMRLADHFSAYVHDKFAVLADELSRVLNVSGHSARIYCEGEIRGHYTFQLVRIVSFLIDRIRSMAKLPPHEIISAGEARGLLLEVARLADFNSIEERTGKGRESCILMVTEVTGDEEIAPGVAGVISLQSLPHLSHLAIRVRQEGVVLVHIPDRKIWKDLRERRGRSVVVRARRDEFEIFDSDISRKRTIVSPKKYFHASPASTTEKDWRPVPLSRVISPTCGSKAEGLRKLWETAQLPEAPFVAKSAVVVPFGSMRNALAANGRMQSLYMESLHSLSGLEGSILRDRLAGLREMLMGLAITTDELYKVIAEELPNTNRFMVRSSSNCEDLSDVAGAGLYDSVASVARENLGEAIALVWSSLWTERAYLNRTKASIPHPNAKMAVIIQEMVSARYSFIIHTCHPTDPDNDRILVESAAGLGETMASASIPGSPYRAALSKNRKDLDVISFAHYSTALTLNKKGDLGRIILDYTSEPLTTDERFRAWYFSRILEIADFVENRFNGPQDIEGAMEGDLFCLLQSRPQH